MFRNKKINGILFLLVIMMIVIVTMHVFQMDRSEISTYVDQRIAEESKLFLQGLNELKSEHLKVTVNLKEKIEILERENTDRKTELESMHTLTKEMAIKQNELFAAHQSDILFEK
jgi:maltodextrin utilization protein YvdJ